MESLDGTEFWVYDQKLSGHLFGCFRDEAHGIASLDGIDEDNVLVETDYPDSDSTCPSWLEVARRRIRHLDPEFQDELLRRNADRLYCFTPAETPAPVPA